MCFRYYFRIEPEEGSKISKAKKKKHAVSPKVITLLQKLNDYVGRTVLA